MINTTMVNQRLAFLAHNIRQLERLANRPKAEFIGSDTAAAAESYLRRSLEAIFDIGRHILAVHGAVELAQEYKSIASGLHELSVVDKKLSGKLILMAGYRNRMVHLYNLINDEELYYIISNDLADIRSFVAQISRYLKKYNL